MYNLTVDEAHTFFVGDGQWLVHNTCWVNELINKRSIAIPEGVSVEDAINEVISNLSGKGIDVSGNIAILEVDGRWYLGFSRELDGTVSGVSSANRLRHNTANNNYLAEGNALAEYYSYNNGVPTEGIAGRLHVTKPPCSSCVNRVGGGNTSNPPVSDFAGRIRAAMGEVGINRLHVTFNNPGNHTLPWTIMR